MKILMNTTQGSSASENEFMKLLIKALLGDIMITETEQSHIVKNGSF